MNMSKYLLLINANHLMLLWLPISTLCAVLMSRMSHHVSAPLIVVGYSLCVTDIANLPESQAHYAGVLNYYRKLGSEEHAPFKF